MNKFFILILGLIMASCSVSKSVLESKKIVKGNWTLNTISYSESGVFKVTLLNDSPAECFKGSLWQFIPNNNTGLYTINNSSCTTGTRHFIFTLEDANNNSSISFLLKPTDEKHKSETNQGFRFSLLKLTQSEMQLQQKVILEGKPFNIIMNFSKIQEK